MIYTSEVAKFCLCGYANNIVQYLTVCDYAPGPLISNSSQNQFSFQKGLRCFYWLRILVCLRYLLIIDGAGKDIPFLFDSLIYLVNFLLT